MPNSALQRRGLAPLVATVRRRGRDLGKPTLMPENFVVPIVMMNEDQSCGPFQGTGFFAENKSLLVTRAHVIGNDQGSYAIRSRDHPDQLFRAKPLLIDRTADLACLAVDGYEAPHILPLASDEDIALNEIVCCFEYGTTVTAGTHISFAPANRIGNVTRFRTLTERYGTAGEHMLEMSFPALRGASGVPLLNKSHLTRYGASSQQIMRQNCFLPRSRKSSTRMAQ